MAEQAQAMRAALQQTAAQTASQGGWQPSIIEPSASAPTPQASNILPQDLLPPEAQQDPAFQTGYGSMYASAQPELARKYGVIRGKDRIPPQLLAGPTGPGTQDRPQQGKLTGKTLEGLQKLTELQKQAEEERLRREAADSPAGAAAGLGSPPTAAADAPTPERQLTTEEVKERLANMDDFDMDQLHQMMVRDLLNNEEQKKIVEERCEPLDLASLVIDGYVTQTVPIVPKVFEPEFQSLSAEEDLACKRLVTEEARQLRTDDRYILDKYALMGLTCALRAISKKPLPDHRDKDGNFSEEAFLRKFNKVLKFPLPMIASLGVHYSWFDLRVRKLFRAEKLKNG